MTQDKSGVSSKISWKWLVVVLIATFGVTYFNAPDFYLTSGPELQARSMMITATADVVSFNSSQFIFDLKNVTLGVVRGAEYTLTAVNRTNVWSIASTGPLFNMLPDEDMRLRYLVDDEIRASFLQLTGTNSDIAISFKDHSVVVTVTNTQSISMKIGYSSSYDDIQLWLGDSTIETSREPYTIYWPFVVPDNPHLQQDMVQLTNFSLDGLELFGNNLEGSVSAAKEVTITRGRGTLEVDRIYNISKGNVLVIRPEQSKIPLMINQIGSEINLTSEIISGYAYLDDQPVTVRKPVALPRVLVALILAVLSSIIVVAANKLWIDKKARRYLRLQVHH